MDLEIIIEKFIEKTQERVKEVAIVSSSIAGAAVDIAVITSNEVKFTLVYNTLIKSGDFFLEKDKKQNGIGVEKAAARYFRAMKMAIDSPKYINDHFAEVVNAYLKLVDNCKDAKSFGDYKAEARKLFMVNYDLDVEDVKLIYPKQK